MIKFIDNNYLNTDIATTNMFNSTHIVLQGMKIKAAHHFNILLVLSIFQFKKVQNLW